jgi:glycosyltransferase involved in cell wall biosynthesis
VGALAGSNVRVVLQSARLGTESDAAWQRSARFGSRIARRCQAARMILATSPLVADELTTAGYDSTRIVTIPWGVPLPPLPSGCAREQAREALAGVNQDLTAAAGDPVAVGVGRLADRSGFAHLVKAWKSVVVRFPAARLWIVGDGPQRQQLYQLIGDLDLRQRVFLPGTFSDTNELLEAADIFVQPATAEGPTLDLADAMATGLPVVASDLPGHREWLAEAHTGRLVPPGDSRALATVLLELLENPSQAISLGSAAREQIRQSHSLSACAERYLSTFSS